MPLSPFLAGRGRGRGSLAGTWPPRPRGVSSPARHRRRKRSAPPPPPAPAPCHSAAAARPPRREWPPPPRLGLRTRTHKTCRRRLPAPRRTGRTPPLGSEAAAAAKKHRVRNKGRMETINNECERRPWSTSTMRPCFVSPWIIVYWFLAWSRMRWEDLDSMVAPNHVEPVHALCVRACFRRSVNGSHFAIR